MDPQASQLGEEVHAPADCTEAGQVPEEEEVEYAFEDEAPEEGTKKRCFAVVRYYFGRISKPKIVFSELCIFWGDVTRGIFGENRYLLEFPLETSLNFVLKGGPLNFKGDALIVVPYDGITRLFEVVIELIPLLIRIYDISMGMMTTGFVTALGAKVGRVLEVGEAVLEVGEAVKDFKRVRVDFALEDSLKYSVQIRVRGRRLMEFMVKYENVPRFYFCCSRIGHAERECPG